MGNLCKKLQLGYVPNEPKLESNFDRLIAFIKFGSKGERSCPAVIDTGATQSLMYSNYVKRIFGYDEDCLREKCKITRIYGITSNIDANDRINDIGLIKGKPNHIDVAYRLKISKVWIGDVGIENHILFVPARIYLDWGKQSKPNYWVDFLEKPYITDGAVLIGTDILRRFDYQVYKEDTGKCFFGFSERNMPPRSNKAIFNFRDWKEIPRPKERDNMLIFPTL